MKMAGAVSVLRTGPLGVNTCIVPLSGSKVLIVDPAGCSFSQDEKALPEFLAANALVPCAVVLTHGHFDHVAGLSAVKQNFPQAAVLIHEKDAPLIGKDCAAAQERSLRQACFLDFLPSVSQLPGPDFFLEDGKQLSSYLSVPGLEKWNVLHTSGHTEGSCCLYNEAEKLLISGDTVFFHSWGRTDFHGGSESEMKKSLSRIYSVIPGNTLVFPGHERYGFELRENL